MLILHVISTWTVIWNYTYTSFVIFFYYSVHAQILCNRSYLKKMYHLLSDKLESIEPKGLSLNPEGF